MADIKISQLGEALVVTDNDVWPMTASGVTNKVKASTMKSYMVDDLEVSDLYDTTITTPTDNDGLVYDSTSQKWKNKPVVTGDLWAQNGAHNLCPFPYYSGGTQIIANLTITVGSKGELTASGTSDGDGNFIFYGGTLKKNTYKFKFKGTFTGDNLVLRVYDSTADIIIGNVSGNNEITFQVDATNENHNFALFINWTGAQSITISGRPLLKLASDPSDVDTPYAMTNGELTELTGALASGYGNVAFQKVGREVIVNGFFQITGDIATNTNVMQIPSGYSPIQNMFVMVNRISDGITRGLVANSSAGYIKTGDQTLPTGYWSIVGTWFV